MKQLLTILLVLFFPLFPLSGQELDNLRQRQLHNFQDTVLLDSLSIIPNSFIVKTATGHVIPKTLYSINFGKAEFYPSQELQDTCSLLIVEYRVFPVLLEKRFAHRDYEQSLSPDSLMGRALPIHDDYMHAVREPDDDRLQTNGSISRGIRFGESQGLSVNSSMNITLNGELENGLMIEGAISDRSIPLQPDGTTHRLEEFDHIHLKIYRNKFALQAGDIELKSAKDGNLLTFKRNVQGLAYEDEFHTHTDTVSIAVAMAVPKGKFARNQIQGREGNQGPYRLQGVNGEPYILILAGSERVYIDGTLLQRGENGHYTIDYNSAELTFTSLMPVNSNSRIAVEFEYSERSYARFNTFASVQQKKGRWQWGLAVFSEQDAKSQPFDQELTPEMQQYLSEIGNNQDLAFYSLAHEVAFDPEQILYEKKDTVVNGENHVIYKHTTNPNVQVYRVYFTYVGEGKGDYIPQFGLANGRAYGWVAPLQGIPQGNYEAKCRLVTPQKHQMIHTQLQHQSRKGTLVHGGYALSNTDLNTFSSLDSKEKIGHAFTLGLNQSFDIGDKGLQLKLGVDALQTTHNFRAIDRFRPIEFERDWNIQNHNLNGGGEQMLQLWTTVSLPNRLYTQLHAEHFALGESYRGKRAWLSGWGKVDSYNSTWSGSVVEANDSLSNSLFFKGKASVGRSMGRVNLAVLGEIENLMATHNHSDSMLGNNFRWHSVKTSLSLPDTLNFTGAIWHQFREDFKPTGNDMRLWGKAHEVAASIAGNAKKFGNISGRAGWRMLTAGEFFSEDVKNEQTMLGRMEYSNQLYKGLWRIATAYELGSGLEPGLEYYYVEVPAGQGVYTWVDYNGNGIMELDEFEIANFVDEARFIRMSMPGTNLISVRTNGFSVSSNLNPSSAFKSQKFLPKQLLKLSNQTNYRVQQKNLHQSFLQFANPWVNNPEDTLITSMSASFRNSLAYNRYSRVFGAEYTMLSSASKSILANGFEMKNRQAHKVGFWVGLGALLSLHAEAEQGMSVSRSELFQHRDFILHNQHVKFTLKYIGGNRYHGEIGIRLGQSDNQQGGEEQEEMEISAQGDFAFSGNASLMVRSTYVDNKFSGNAQSSVAYEMMKGLQPGKNITWEMHLRRRLTKVFELELGYNGRRLGDGKVIHSGSMMARALF